MLMRSVTCECGALAELNTGERVYPHRQDLWHKRFWVCPADGWRVGCHGETTAPLGTPASPATQRARRSAHELFDELWRRKMRRDSCSKKSARGAGYRWLASELGIDPSQCHIGMMSRETALRVVEICAPYVRE